VSDCEVSLIPRPHEINFYDVNKHKWTCR